jgi:hypothetical protein
MLKKFTIILVLFTLLWSNSVQAMRKGFSSSDEGEGFKKKSALIIRPISPEVVSPPQVDQAPEPKMKFKLGFEFQESSSLCPWALYQSVFQKVPFFGLRFKYIHNDKKSWRPLWKVVIDTNDVEFVTEPFTHEEKLHVESAVKTLLVSLDLLKNLMNSEDSITFSKWTYKLEDFFVGTPFRVFYFGKYETVKEMELIGKKPWHPRFSPQVTIQHPLEYTIPLYFGLFGFDSPSLTFFQASFPFRNEFLKAYLKVQETADIGLLKELIKDFNTKLNGLLFLHSLTIVHMSNVEEYNDRKLLKKTKKNLALSHQVDAKMRLTLMSRRPFSSMFNDIHTQGNYSEYFIRAMFSNKEFLEYLKLFPQLNYAEQYVDSEGKPINLSALLPAFDEAFLKENEDLLVPLLEQGVLSTTMIRHFNENVEIDNQPSKLFFDQYIPNIMRSIDKPQKTYIININDRVIQSIPWKYDMLSPPCFQDSGNSMGKFRETLNEEELQFGEAIIEVRGISNVHSWFLRKTKSAESKKGTFLKNIDTTLQEGLSLFDFLIEFGKGLYDIEIFSLGMPYALQRFALNREEK